jgi:hypothetical protein
MRSVTRTHRVLIALIGAVVAIAAALPVASATEPRPWLCRDKPVFSNNAPMSYEIAHTGRQRWKIFFMQFQPDAIHDGYEIVASHDIAAPVSGRLNAGQYFVAAMYLARNGRWICQGAARPEGDDHAGVLAGLCFGAHESQPCSVTLTVKAADASAPAAH